MDWVDIKKELPGTKEPVVYAKPNRKGGFDVGIAYWTVSNRWNPQLESKNSPEGFTHWIPLPDPPRL